MNSYILVEETNKEDFEKRMSYLIDQGYTPLDKVQVIKYYDEIGLSIILCFKYCQAVYKKPKKGNLGERNEYNKRKSNRNDRKRNKKRSSY